MIHKSITGFYKRLQLYLHFRQNSISTILATVTENVTGHLKPQCGFPDIQQATYKGKLCPSKKFLLESVLHVLFATFSCQTGLLGSIQKSAVF